MKEFLNKLAEFLESKGTQYNDAALTEVAGQVREHANKVVSSSETNNNEEDTGGGDHPPKPPGQP